MSIEYLLVVMAVGLTTLTALTAALPHIQRSETRQLKALYRSVP